jgi:hypothetical protein
MIIRYRSEFVHSSVVAEMDLARLELRRERLRRSKTWAPTRLVVSLGTTARTQTDTSANDTRDVSRRLPGAQIDRILQEKVRRG